MLLVDLLDWVQAVPVDRYDDGLRLASSVVDRPDRPEDVTIARAKYMDAVDHDHDEADLDCLRRREHRDRLRCKE